jgi:hypothetical protein
VLAKLAWTTLVATLVFGVCSLLYLKGLVTLGGLSAVFGL